MIKTLTFAKRQAGLDLDEFRAWYEEEYVTGRSGDPERHRRNHVLRSHRPAGWEPNFDVVDERWYADRVHLDVDRRSDPLATATAAEVDSSLTRTFVVEEAVSEIPGSSHEFGTKLMLLMNRHDLFDMAAFRHRYEHGHAALARKMLAPALLTYERNYRSEVLSPGWEDEFDVVTAFEFAADVPRRGSQDELAYLIRDEEVFMDRSSQRFIQVDPVGGAH